MTVNKENMRLWVEALRSGEYPQTTGVLFRETTQMDDHTGKVLQPGYCCLGVACDVAVKNGLVFEDDDEDNSEPDQDWWRDGHGDLPWSVAAWLGLPLTHNPTIVSADPADKTSSTITAASANDDRGWTFLQIADAIEAKYLTPQKEEVTV